MDTPNINTIKAMPKEELDALNRKLATKFAIHAVGAIWLRLAVQGVVRTLATKAIIEAAKRA